jgi:hypothetical protein
MNKFTHEMTDKVLKEIDNINETGLKKKIKMYLELLDVNGFNLPSQYMDKIEGYKGLFELRPHFHNIEFRMVFFWQSNTAMIIHAFYERGNTRKNQREYDTAETIRKQIIEGR